MSSVFRILLESWEEDRGGIKGGGVKGGQIEWRTEEERMKWRIEEQRTEGRTESGVCEVVMWEFKSSRRSSSCRGCRKSASTHTWPAGSASGARHVTGCSSFSSGMGSNPQTPHAPHTPGWSSYLMAQRYRNTVRRNKHSDRCL